MFQSRRAGDDPALHDGIIKEDQIISMNIQLVSLIERDFMKELSHIRPERSVYPTPLDRGYCQQKSL